MFVLHIRERIEMWLTPVDISNLFWLPVCTVHLPVGSQSTLNQMIGLFSTTCENTGMFQLFHL